MEQNSIIARMIRRLLPTLTAALAEARPWRCWDLDERRL
jgi:hypothetical protein